MADQATLVTANARMRIADGGVDTNELQDSGVTEPKLDDSLTLRPSMMCLPGMGPSWSGAPKEARRRRRIRSNTCDGRRTRRLYGGTSFTGRNGVQRRARKRAHHCTLDWDDVRLRSRGSDCQRERSTEIYLYAQGFGARK